MPDKDAKCYVYLYRDAHGVPRYIGKGCGDRALSHIGLAAALNQGRRHERATHFTRWLAKCLRECEPFTCETVRDGLLDAQAFKLEQELIAKHKRHREPGGTLYNTLAGGEGFTSADAKRISNRPDVKLKKSLAVKAAFNNPDARKRLSEATKESNGRAGRREQARQKALLEWAAPERRAAAARRAKELWADPHWAAARRAELVARNKSGGVAR